MTSAYLLAALFVAPPVLWCTFFIYCWVAFRKEINTNSSEFARSTPGHTESAEGALFLSPAPSGLGNVCGMRARRAACPASVEDAPFLRPAPSGLGYACGTRARRAAPIRRWSQDRIQSPPSLTTKQTLPRNCAACDAPPDSGCSAQPYPPETH